jgi:hypothetical protein
MPFIFAVLILYDRYHWTWVVAFFKPVRSPCRWVGLSTRSVSFFCWQVVKMVAGRFYESDCLLLKQDKIQYGLLICAWYVRTGMIASDGASQINQHRTLYDAWADSGLTLTTGSRLSSLWFVKRFTGWSLRRFSTGTLASKHRRSFNGIFFD